MKRGELKRTYHSIVELVAPVVCHELITKSAYLGIHDKTLKIEMGES